MPAPLDLRILRTSKGVTLIELLVAIFIIAIGLLGAAAAFQLVSTSVQSSRVQTVANTLCEEQMERLKEYSYYQLLVTTSTTVDTRFTPALNYDNTDYVPQTIAAGGTSFLRTTRVDFAYRYNATISTTIWTTQDTGLKMVTVNVSWLYRGLWRTQTLQNVVSNPNYNPLNAIFKGTVYKNGGGTLPGAQIQVVENTSWFNYSQAGGAYSFNVSPGTYTLQCSLLGYYPSTTASYLPIANDQTIVQDFTLSPIATGTVSGYIYDFNSLVISQVVSSTDTAGALEYVELYNPTPQDINVKNNIDMVYWDNSNSSTTVLVTWVSTYVPVNRYYLIANAPTVNAGGKVLPADAIYSNPNYLVGGAPGHLISNLTAGGVGLVNHISGAIVDKVAWTAGAGNPAPASGPEGTAITPASGAGLAIGEQFVRMTAPGAVNPAYGNAYDSGNNNLNFVDSLAFSYSPHNVASGNKVPMSGVPAPNALINMTDFLSGTVRSVATTMPGGYPVASFTIPSVATGTWSMNAYLNAWGKANFIQMNNIVIQPLVSTGVPNGSTAPNWVVPGSTNTLLTSTSNYAVIAGTILDPYGAPLPNIKVSFGAKTTFTGSDGSYFLVVPSGINTLYANTAYFNPAYTLGLLYLTVSAGNVYDPENITIYFGGTLQGYFQTPTGSPLPNRSAVAVFGIGNEYSQAVSDPTGYFYLRNITTGTYTITPALDNAEIAVPSSITGILSSTGAATFVSTFTITNALGTIQGQTLQTTTPITTGVLVVASTSPILSPLPPPLVGSVTPTCHPCYYSDISDGSGNFTLNVRSDPNPYFVYGWLSAPAPGGFTTTAQSFSIIISTGQIYSQNLVW